MRKRRSDESGVRHYFNSSIAGRDWVRCCFSIDGSFACLLEIDPALGAAGRGFVVVGAREGTQN